MLERRRLVAEAAVAAGLIGAAAVAAGDAVVGLAAALVLLRIAGGDEPGVDRCVLVCDLRFDGQSHIERGQQWGRSCSDATLRPLLHIASWAGTAGQPT